MSFYFIFLSFKGLSFGFGFASLINRYSYIIIAQPTTETEDGKPVAHYGSLSTLQKS